MPPTPSGRGCPRTCPWSPRASPGSSPCRSRPSWGGAATTWCGPSREDGTEQLVPVEVGLVTDTLAAVTSGIDDGTTVITGTVSQQANGSSSTQQGGAFPLGGLGGGGAFPGAARSPRAAGHPAMSAVMLPPGTAWLPAPYPRHAPTLGRCSSTSVTCGVSTTSARWRSRRSEASASRSARASSWPSSDRRARASRPS